jgi:hypothetical protein
LDWREPVRAENLKSTGKNRNKTGVRCKIPPANPDDLMADAGESH